MSVQASLTKFGLEELYNPPTLKEMCLYKCLTNSDILTKEILVEEAASGSENLDWEKYRLKEPIQQDLVEALLDLGDKYLFMLTPRYVPLIAAIRSSQPENLVKVSVSNTSTLEDRQLEWLLSGGHVKSLDIHSCHLLTSRSLDAINKFGNQLEYLRIGDTVHILPSLEEAVPGVAILKTPRLKTLVLSQMFDRARILATFFTCLMQEFIYCLEELHMTMIGELPSLEFLEPAKTTLTSLTLSNCLFYIKTETWGSLFQLTKLRSLDLHGTQIELAFQGVNVLQRLVSSMPELTRLAANPPLFKNLNVTMTKRLQLLAVVSNDEQQLARAKNIAKDVVSMGTMAGQFQTLQFFSTRLNNGVFDRTLFHLVHDLLNDTPEEMSGPVISLIMQMVKNGGIDAMQQEALFLYLKTNLNSTVTSKLGIVFLDQIVDVITSYIEKWPNSQFRSEEEIKAATNLILQLDKNLNLGHFAQIVTEILHLMEEKFPVKTKPFTEISSCKSLLRNAVKLLDHVAGRFPGEVTTIWGIPSIVTVLKGINESMKVIKDKWVRDKFVDCVSNLIASLKNLCLNSGPRRAALYAAEGVVVILDLLDDINGGYLRLAEQDSTTLLEIIKCVVQGDEMDRSELPMVAASLESIMLSSDYRWDYWPSYRSVTEATHDLKMKTIGTILKLIETTVPTEYMITGTAKEIVDKFN